MISIEGLKKDIDTLKDFQLQELYNYMGERMTFNSMSKNLPSDCRESRFYKGEVCPHCSSESIVKNGKLHDRQRYKCKSCGKTFNDFTKSSISSTKLFSDDKETVKIKNMLIHSVISFTDTRIKIYPTKEPAFV